MRAAATDRRLEALLGTPSSVFRQMPSNRVVSVPAEFTIISQAVIVPDQPERVITDVRNSSSLTRLFLSYNSTTSLLRAYRSTDVSRNQLVTLQGRCCFITRVTAEESNYWVNGEYRFMTEAPGDFPKSSLWLTLGYDTAFQRPFEGAEAAWVYPRLLTEQEMRQVSALVQSGAG